MDKVNPFTEVHKSSGDQTSGQPKSQSYAEWAKSVYNEKYEQWMPWIEDQYLKWFGKGDNKASYVTRGK